MRDVKASAATSAHCVGATARTGATLRLLFALAFASLALLAIAAPASAETEGYAYSFTFHQPGPATGLFGFGMGIAVDQSNGNVYVTEYETHRVLKFDADGNFREAWGYGVSDGQNQSEVCVAPDPCQAGIAGTAPGQFSNPTGIAVDNSNGPNKGDVYVVDGPSPYSGIGPGVILKFDSNGNFLRKIDGAESDTGVFQQMGWNGAVSVDGNGFVWVTGGPVMKFSNETDNEFVLGSEWSDQYPVWSVVANANGTRLLVGGYGDGNGESPYIVSAGGTALVNHLPCGGYFNGGDAFNPATDNFLVGNGGEVCEFTQKGVLVSRFSVPNGVGSIAVNQNTGNVYVAGGQDVSVFIPRVVPDVTTGDVTNLGHTSATLTGEVAPDPAGGGNVTDCHFEIGTDTSYGTSVPCTPATPYSGDTTVTADVSGLNMETTYHYRLVAANSIDSNAGEDRTFTPHAVLGLKTDSATNLAPTSATLNASLDPNGDDTSYHFEWGTDTSYGNTSPATPGTASGSGLRTVSTDLTGLSSYTKYHYRIVATNSLGTSYGEDQTFTTAPPALPGISGTAVSGITDRGATVSGAIRPGFGATSYVVEYGTGTSYGSRTAASQPLAPDNAEHQITAQLSDLAPETTYHFRIVATNFGGTTHGPDQVFTTLDRPSIGAEGASAVGETSATLTGRINPQRSATKYRFEYGPTASYGSATRQFDLGAADGSSHDVSAALSGLAPGTTYHFRIVASNGIGQTVGFDHTFTTAPRPSQQAPQRSRKCKKGFVKRHGRCVNKHHRRLKKHHRKRRHHHRHARRSHG